MYSDCAASEMTLTVSDVALLALCRYSIRTGILCSKSIYNSIYCNSAMQSLSRCSHAGDVLLVHDGKVTNSVPGLCASWPVHHVWFNVVIILKFNWLTLCIVSFLVSLWFA